MNSGGLPARATRGIFDRGELCDEGWSPGELRRELVRCDVIAYRASFPKIR